MTVKEFKEKNKEARDDFVKKMTEINDMEKDIDRVNEEIKKLELDREELFVFPRKQITIVIRFLMLLSLCLAETAFFMVFGPQILAIPDVLIKAMFSILAISFGGVLAVWVNNFTNNVIKKSLMISDKNIVNSEEYKEYNKIIKEKELEKSKIFNELLSIRNEIKDDLLENCKNLVRINNVMRDNENEESLIEEDKALRKIRIINKRN